MRRGLRLLELDLSKVLTLGHKALVRRNYGLTLNMWRPESV